MEYAGRIFRVFERLLTSEEYLALIIGGAGASIPKLMILCSMFKRKVVLDFAVSVFLAAIAGGYLIEFLAY